MSIPPSTPTDYGSLILAKILSTDSKSHSSAPSNSSTLAIPLKSNKHKKSLPPNQPVSQSAPPSSTSLKKNKSKLSKSLKETVPENDDLHLLRVEIEKLGGDEEDLALFDGLSDPEELQGDTLEDPGLKTDLKKFIKALDFSAASSIAFPSETSEQPTTPLTGTGSGTSKPTPIASKSDMTQSALSNLAALEAKLDDPLEKAKLDKREAKINQRRLEAQKREDRAAQEKELAASQDRQLARQETRAMVDQVKQRLVPGQLSKKTQVWAIQPHPIWYDTSSLPPLATPPKMSPSLTEASITLLQARADYVLKTISNDFTQSLQPSKQSGLNKKTTFGGLSESDKAFIHKILSSGTSGDKLSALTLLVSSAPLQSRTHLSTLLSLCKKKNREEAGRTMRAVVEWLRGGGNGALGGLPARKLKYFRDQPGLGVVAQLQGLAKGKCKLKHDDENRLEGDEWLALWAFEDWLKRWYLDLLRVIESFSHDPLVFTRTQSLSHLFYLLNDKPEQEQNLLSLLVNKLGDSDKMICSWAYHYLLQLLQVHPLMKPIVIREVSGLVLKPVGHSKKTDAKAKKTAEDQSLRHHDHARYYGTITLNQIALTKGDKEIANKLIEVYFEVFNDILGKSSVEEAAMVAGGEVEMNEEELEAEHVLQQEAIRKRGKGGKPALGGKTSQVISEEEAQAEKKGRLVAAVLTGLNRALPYGTLDSASFEGQMDTLFRISHTGLFSVSIQALMLIQHLVKPKPQLADRFYRVLYGTLVDHRLLGANSKHGLYLNLLFKSIKADQDQNRVFAFVKRIIQCLGYHQPSFICATIVLLGDLFSTTQFPFRQKLMSNELATVANEKKKIRVSKDKKKEKKSGELEGSKDVSSNQGEEKEGSGEYDGRKRDPKFANAQESCLWELVPLLSHYHPAVSLNAGQLLSGQLVSSTVDLAHHSLAHFLDRFVYRQPKQAAAPKGSAIMQPDLHTRLADVPKARPAATAKREAEVAVNSMAFAERKEEDVAAEEVFFHKFFAAKAAAQKKPLGTKMRKPVTEAEDFGGRGGSDDGSVSSAEEEGSIDEEEVWGAMRAGMGTELGDADPDLDDDDEGEGWSEMDAEESGSDGGLAEMLAEDEELESGFGLEEEASSRSEESDEELVAPGGSEPGQLKRGSEGAERDQSKKRRKLMRSLPTFAMPEDLLGLVSGSDEED